jgi:hypothetical protein
MGFFASFFLSFFGVKLHAPSAAQSSNVQP